MNNTEPKPDLLKKGVQKCFNCKHASKPFLIGEVTHHQCIHEKHHEGMDNGSITPWDTLRKWHETCESFKTGMV